MQTEKNHRFLFYYRIFLVALSTFLCWEVTAGDHLIAISHKNDVNKKITVYDPGTGMQLFSHAPEGDFEENIPTWIVSSSATQRLFVSATVEEEGHGHGKEEGHEHEGIVEVIDYSQFPSGSIFYADEVETGARPFHNYVAPDGRVGVSNDEDGTFSLIDPTTLDVETITAGHDHGTAVFVGDAAGYDIYVGRFEGEENPGAVDVVDWISSATRERIEPLLPNPHTGVYSSVSQRVYFACIGGLEVIGTQGAEKDVHLGTIPLPEGHEAELKISVDGRMIYGNILPEHDHEGEKLSEEEAEPLIFAYDVINDTTHVLEEAPQAADIALSPDGNFLVAGDFEPHEGEDPHVVIVDASPESATFMTVLQEYDLGSNTGVPTVAGFSGSRFSPDGEVAYVTLTQRDEVMVIDMQTFATSTFAVEPAPWFLHVFEVEGTEPSSSVEAWHQFE